MPRSVIDGTKKVDKQLWLVDVKPKHPMVCLPLGLLKNPAWAPCLAADVEGRGGHASSPAVLNSLESTFGGSHANFVTTTAR